MVFKFFQTSNTYVSQKLTRMRKNDCTLIPYGYPILVADLICKISKQFLHTSFLVGVCTFLALSNKTINVTLNTEISSFRSCLGSSSWWSLYCCHIVYHCDHRLAVIHLYILDISIKICCDCLVLLCYFCMHLPNRYGFGAY